MKSFSKQHNLVLLYSCVLTYTIGGTFVFPLLPHLLLPQITFNFDSEKAKN